MFICRLGGVDHINLGDMVYKYVWLLYTHQIGHDVSIRESVGKKKNVYIGDPLHL